MADLDAAKVAEWLLANGFLREANAVAQTVPPPADFNGEDPTAARAARRKAAADAAKAEAKAKA